MPDGAADLVADLYRRLPETRITDILLEVDDATPHGVPVDDDLGPSGGGARPRFERPLLAICERTLRHRAGGGGVATRA